MDSFPWQNHSTCHAWRSRVVYEWTSVRPPQGRRSVQGWATCSRCCLLTQMCPNAVVPSPSWLLQVGAHANPPQTLQVEVGVLARMRCTQWRSPSSEADHCTILPQAVRLRRAQRSDTALPQTRMLSLAERILRATPPCDVGLVRSPDEAASPSRHSFYISYKLPAWTWGGCVAFS